MPHSDQKTLTPLVLVLGCWILALALGIYHGPGLGADAERLHQLGEASSERSILPILLSRLADATGIALVQAAVDEPKRALYLGENTIGGVEAPAPISAAPDEIPDDSLVTEEQAPSALIEPQRVLIVGASSIQYELGRAIERLYREREGVEAHRLGRHSTGLARPDYFDWPQKAQDLADEFEPDLVIAQWGGNDGQGVTNHAGRGLARFGTDAWEQIYGERVTEVVTSLQAGGAEVVLLGMPIMQKVRFRKKITRINEVIRTAATAAGATFVDTVEMTADDNGRYRRRAEVDGRTRIIRATDGMHLTQHGAALISVRIVARLEEQGNPVHGGQEPTETELAQPQTEAAETTH